ncbi:MAG: molybdopterin-containing oxidoreductase family protein [Ardenticatenaceae bacterium]
MLRSKIRGTCPHDCPDTCGMITEVESGRAVKFYGDPDHAVTQGWLCGKVRPYLDHVYHPERLRYPLRRVGAKGAGEWRRISWDEALAEIGERWRGIIAQYGAAAILPYSYSGTMGLVQNWVAAARFFNRLGASQLQRSICGAAAEMAVEMTLGTRMSQPYEAVESSQVVLIWGHNPVSTAPHFMPALIEAKRKGTQVIVIDPRRTKSAKLADWHIAPLPATDGALALGLAHIIVREGWHDEAWLAEHTIGWAVLNARLPDYPPERVAQITGLSVGTIEQLARLYATQTPSLIKIADGLQRHPNGGQTVRAILALPALTGQYGVRGGGISYSTSGTTRWDGETISCAAKCPPPARTVNMNRLGAALLGEVQDPPLKSLYVFMANPVASSPNASQIIEGLRREDLFTVVHELFMTDSADYADIVLPATSQLEHADLHKGYGHTFLSYNAPAIAPLAECKSNWEVSQLLAQEMGFDEPWLHHSTDEIITDILQNSRHNNPHLAGITLARLKAEGAIRYPLESDIPFADGKFPTPSGKVELYCDALISQGIDPIPTFVPADDNSRPEEPNHNGQFPDDAALSLICGASHHMVSSTFSNHPSTLKQLRVPTIHIHPDDAASRKIATGDMVRVINKRGSIQLLAKVDQSVRPGVVSSDKGRWHKHTNGNNVNMLSSDAIGDLAGQSTFHTNRVWLQRL